MQHDDTAQLARNILGLRARRVDHLPAELLGEPAWDMLLILFIADAGGEQLSVAEAVRRLGAPVSTSARWLECLAQHGLAAYHRRDGAERCVALMPIGVDAVEACMNDARTMMAPCREVRP